MGEWARGVNGSDGLFCCDGGHIAESSPEYPKVIRGKVRLSVILFPNAFKIRIPSLTQFSPLELTNVGFQASDACTEG